MSYLVAKCPSDRLALLNSVIVSPDDDLAGTEYILACPDHNPAGYAFSLVTDKGMAKGQLGFTFHQRKWAELALNRPMLVKPFSPQADANGYMSSVKFEVDMTAKKGRPPAEPLNGEEMAKLFQERYNNLVVTVGQLLVFDFKGTTLICKALEIETISLDKLLAGGKEEGHKNSRGLLMSQTSIGFDKAEGSQLNLVGSAKGGERTTLINPDWNFEQMGIGGLDSEFTDIFRRAFASRVFPPDLVKKLGIMHVKGILLYGPPGTGKTLMARQIGKMLNAVEPKIVNGPEILDKYVGQSEQNIRNLFMDAEAEQAAKGDFSQLHIIIFDEFDAICKQRGNSASSSGVGDTVVNQLLSKIDGVDQLNNILLIGMTNRRDLIDEALLRPGRLEVQMEINLPDEHGRFQILQIHTANMKANDMMDTTVDLAELAAMSKNYSGAEIAGLVKSASSFAFNRHIDPNNLGKIDEAALKNLKITMDDFVGALDEVKPAFGVTEDVFAECVRNGVVEWCPQVQRILDDGKLLVDQVKNSPRTPLVSVLLEGPPGVGKTALAATMAISSDYPFVKLIAPELYVGMSESAKCNAITKVFDDAYKSPIACIVIDNIERLLEYVPIGPRFSNNVLQTLLVLINRVPTHERRLLILATTSQRMVMQDMGMLDVFNKIIGVPLMTTVDHVFKGLDGLGLFDEETTDIVRRSLKESPIQVSIGVKPLLMLAEMSRQDEDNKMENFLLMFREECVKHVGRF